MPSTTGDARLPAEQRARVRIDRQLEGAGWAVQSRGDLNLFAGRGVARREVTMAPGHGRVDHLLDVDKAVVGVIEAKPEGTTLSGVEWQSSRYAVGLPDDVRRKLLADFDLRTNRHVTLKQNPLRRAEVDEDALTVD